MSTDVSLKNLRKVFVDKTSGRTATAVEDFSIEIKKGELLTLLGPSGCGKTTVLRMLAGFEKPSSGKIFFGDRDVTALPPNLRNSAMVFQSYALFPHMTVRENIAYGLKFRNWDSKTKATKLEQIIQTVNLSGYESRKSSELSGGQQQRVALARSLIVEPDILLFDEPLSNLDAKLRESMRIEIRRLQTRLGTTALYVTHDQIESMSLSDRVVVMSKGRIEQIGTPAEIYNCPRTKFVADFMGWTNFIDAQVVGDSDGKLQLKSKDFEISVPRRSEISLEGTRNAISMIRPEDIRFGNSGVSAKVLESTFLGDRHEVLVTLASGAKLTARVKRDPKDPSFKPGDQVHLSFQETQLSYLAA